MSICTGYRFFPSARLALRPVIGPARVISAAGRIMKAVELAEEDT